MCLLGDWKTMKKAEQCDPPNTYPLARRVIGRYAPGTRRASDPVPVIADVGHENRLFALSSG